VQRKDLLLIIVVLVIVSVITPVLILTMGFTPSGSAGGSPSTTTSTPYTETETGTVTISPVNEDGFGIVYAYVENVDWYEYNWIFAMVIENKYKDVEIESVTVNGKQPFSVSFNGTNMDVFVIPAGSKIGVVIKALIMNVTEGDHVNVVFHFADGRKYEKTFPLISGYFETTGLVEPMFEVRVEDVKLVEDPSWNYLRYTFTVENKGVVPLVITKFASPEMWFISISRKTDPNGLIWESCSLSDETRPWSPIVILPGESTRIALNLSSSNLFETTVVKFMINDNMYETFVPNPEARFTKTTKPLVKLYNYFVEKTEDGWNITLIVANIADSYMPLNFIRVEVWNDNNTLKYVGAIWVDQSTIRRSGDITVSPFPTRPGEYAIVELKLGNEFLPGDHVKFKFGSISYNSGDVTIIFEYEITL